MHHGHHTLFKAKQPFEKTEVFLSFFLSPSFVLAAKGSYRKLLLGSAVASGSRSLASPAVAVDF